jgi:beta-lactamase class A
MSELAQGRLFGVARRVAVCCRPLSAFRDASALDYGAEELFPAASVIKTGIMACLLRDVHLGLASLQDRISIGLSEMVKGAGVLFEMEPREYTLAELCRLMMVVSDNTASNACLRQVGMERLNKFFLDRGYLAEVQRFFMSPVIDGKDNTMTAESAAFMLADLYQGVGLDPELREFAIGCLRRQQYREKIPLLLPEDLVVGHKTGELDGVRHDAAVVEWDEPYILVILTADGDSPWEVDQAMAHHSLRILESKVGAKS